MAGIPRRIAGEHGSSGEFQIPSSDRSAFYYPRLTVQDERFVGWCGCPGFLYRHDCRHLSDSRAIVRWERQQAADRVQQDQRLVANGMIRATTYGVYDPAVERTPVVFA